MIDGQDGDALVLWFGGSWFFGFLVFCSVWLGLRGFLGCTWDSWAISFWDAGFLSFSLFRWTFEFFSFLFLFWGLRGSEPWGWLWTWFSWLSAHWDFRYIMIWHTIFFLVYYGLGDGAT